MFKDKAYVCNLCRKVITYSLEEAGQTMPCPFCKEPVTLPAGPLKQEPLAPSRKPLLRWLALALLLLAATAGGVWFLTRPGLQPSQPDSAEEGQKSSIGTFIKTFIRKPPPVVTAPAPAKMPGTDVTVAVTEFNFGCPEIYQTVFKRVVKTETSVCCVWLRLTNTGQHPVTFQPWWLPYALGDAKKNATLTTSNASPHDIVSFGSESPPVGAQAATNLVPGATLTDVILFLCDTRPERDLYLTLPSENLGGKGNIHFLIPASMITDVKEE